MGVMVGGIGINVVVGLITDFERVDEIIIGDGVIFSTVMELLVDKETEVGISLGDGVILPFCRNVLDEEHPVNPILAKMKQYIKWKIKFWIFISNLCIPNYRTRLAYYYPSKTSKRVGWVRF